MKNPRSIVNSDQRSAQTGAASAGLWKVAILLAALAGTLCFGQDSGASSLAEAARGNPPKKAHRVITNDDLPSREPEAASAAGTVGRSSGDSSSASSTSGGASSSADAARTAPSRSLTVDQAAVRLQKLKDEESALRRRYDEIQSKLATTDDSNLRRVYADSLSKRDETLAKKRKEIEEAETALRMTTDAASGRGGPHAEQ